MWSLELQSPPAQPTVLLTWFVWIFDIFPKLAKDQTGVSVWGGISDLLCKRIGLVRTVISRLKLAWLDVICGPISTPCEVRCIRERQLCARMLKPLGREKCWWNPDIHFLGGTKNRVAGQGMEKTCVYVIISIGEYMFFACLFTFAQCDKYQIE